MANPSNKQIARNNQTNASGPLTIQQTSIFSGPLPPPDTLAQYDDILTGAADRILSMAEKEQERRHQNENKIVYEQLKYRRLGMLIGGLIGIIGAGGSIAAMILGSNTAGIIALAGT